MHALTSKFQPNNSISSQTNGREIGDGVSESVSDKGSQCRQLNQLFSNVGNLFTIQILPELQFQNLDQTLCSRSEQKFSFMTKPQVPNLRQAAADTSASTSATVATSTSFELTYSQNRVTSIKSAKCYGVSQWVTDKGCQWSVSGPIKTILDGVSTTT